MIPDYNKIFDNYKSAKNKSIHPFIQKLYDGHMLESVRKLDSNHTFITIAFCWTDLNTLYKLTFIDKETNTAKVSLFERDTVHRYIVYGHLVVSNDNLLITDGTIYSYLDSNGNFYINEPTTIIEDHKITLHDLFNIRNDLLKSIYFNFNYLIFLARSIYDRVHLIKHKDIKYFDIHSNKELIKKNDFIKETKIDCIYATTNHYIEILLKFYLSKEHSYIHIL